MKLFIDFITLALFAITSFAPTYSNENKLSPKPIDALILSYDAMYNAIEDSNRDYLIIDMESLAFIETTAADRCKMQEHFKIYNKPVISASLFKLKEMGFMDDLGKLRLNSVVFMFKSIDFNNSDLGVDIDGIKFVSPNTSYIYHIHLNIENNKWILKSIELKEVA